MSVHSLPALTAFMSYSKPQVETISTDPQPAVVPIPALPQVVAQLPGQKPAVDAPEPRQPPNGAVPDTAVRDAKQPPAVAAAAAGGARNASSGNGNGIASVPNRRRPVRDPDDIDMPDPAKVKPADPAAVAEAAKVPVAPLQSAAAAELRRLFDLGVKVSIHCVQYCDRRCMHSGAAWRAGISGIPSEIACVIGS